MKRWMAWVGAGVSVAGALVGCGGPRKADGAEAVNAVRPSATADPSTSSSTSTSTRKKRRRTGAAKGSHDGTKPKGGRPLNPRDAASGRTVFVSADDRCFVEMPSTEKHPDGSFVRATEDVDCPEEMNDPAWDHCTAQIVLDDAGKCYCVSGAPPRPMPFPTACPAQRSER